MKAASLLKMAPMLTVPQGMRAANFSSAQSTNPALQMRVRRMLAKDTPPPTNVDITSPMPTVSTLSTPPAAPASTSATTMSSTSQMARAKPKLDVIWLTATGKAKEVANIKRLKRHTSEAMKRATKMYYKENGRGRRASRQNKYLH